MKKKTKFGPEVSLRVWDGDMTSLDFNLSVHFIAHRNLRTPVVSILWQDPDRVCGVSPHR
jgi:hypothetical protein